MIDVKAVIEGTFHAKTLTEALEASVVVVREQELLDKGKAQVFTYVAEIARSIFGTWQERHQHGQLNDPNAEWWALAAADFQQQAEQALAYGKVKDWSGKEMGLFANAQRTLHNAMAENAPLLERDAAGNYKLGGKTAIEQWNAKLNAQRKAAKHKEAMEKIRASGFNPEQAKQQPTAAPAKDKGKEGQAETGLPDFGNATLNRKFAEFVEYFTLLAAVTEKGRNGETGIDKLIRLTESWTNTINKVLDKDFAAVVKAAEEEAANDEQEQQSTGTDG